MRLGDLLIQKGLVNQDQVRIALTEQKKQNIPLGKIFVRLGFVSETAMRDVLGESIGQESVDLTKVVADQLGLESPQGALIVSMKKDGVGAAAGLRVGMVITAINNFATPDIRAYNRAITQHPGAQNGTGLPQDHQRHRRRPHTAGAPRYAGPRRRRHGVPHARIRRVLG